MTKVPAGRTPFVRLLKLFDWFESEHCDGDWHLAATRLRKFYYNSRAFDLLIEGRVEVPSAKGQLSKEQQRFMGRHKNLQIGGQEVDVSHALVGLDSELDTSAQESSVWMISDAHRTPAATWAGDLGSAMAHWGHKTSGPNSVDAYVGKYASEADLLGDIDGINLAHLDVVSQAHKERMGWAATSLETADTLAGKLRAYYADRAGSGDSFIVRCVPFAVIQGLEFDQSGKLSEQATRFIEEQVVEAAFLVSASIGAKSLSDSGRDGEGKPQAPLPAADESTPGGVEAAVSYDPAVDVKKFVAPFTGWLETGLRSEINDRLPTYEDLRKSFEESQ